ncbi:ADP-ribosylhydrolase ARH1-like [Amphiura filiformis]|uniref:ADP-ribosylhydrolase ARH1-like n=1 Tax=Amphiura filiformis TaxID=82378 RepID=UPI003B21B7CE
MSLESFQAALVLGACGEALGSMNSKWDRYASASAKQKCVSDLGGVGNIEVSDISWQVEEGTILHLSSSEALASGKSSKSYLHELATRYVDCMGSSMSGKRPSNVLLQATTHLRPAEPDGCLQTFNHNATDGRAALRGVCVGLRFHKPNNIEQLIATAIETTRMTHHNPIAYLGALTAALFTSYAIQGRELREWGAGLLHILPIALGYVVSAGDNLEANQLAWNDFGRAWEPYIQMRGITDGQSKPKFPRKYGAQKRDEVYKQFAAPGEAAGRWGHDAPLIAYDALMSCGGSWEELCNRAMFHGGDGRGSGSIAASWYGVTYGFAGVPSCNHTEVEFRERFIEAGRKLYELSW